MIKTRSLRDINKYAVGTIVTVKYMDFLYVTDLLDIYVSSDSEEFNMLPDKYKERIREKEERHGGELVFPAQYELNETLRLCYIKESCGVFIFWDPNRKLELSGDAVFDDEVFKVLTYGDVATAADAIFEYYTYDILNKINVGDFEDIDDSIKRSKKAYKIVKLLNLEY